MSFSPALLEHSEQVLQASVTKYLGQKSSDVANGGPALLEYRPPPSQNTTCMLRIEDGRMPFTVMLQLEGLAFPHHVGLLCKLVFSLSPCPQMLSTCSSSTLALTRKMRLMVLQVKWQGSQEESRTSSHSSKAAKIVYRNCTGSRIKQGKWKCPWPATALAQTLSSVQNITEPCTSFSWHPVLS